MRNKLMVLLSACLMAMQVQAKTVVILHAISSSGIGDVVGEVALEDSKYGLLLQPNLAGLPCGLHGFHVHANASCAAAAQDGKLVAGLAAGGHVDPANTGKHLGPYNDAGHLGDLPPLYVAADGTATMPMLAPRLRLADVKQHALMVHAAGDNFADHPQPLGGGGARMFCGVIE